LRGREDETADGIPEVVRVAVVAVEPTLVVVVFDVEDVEIAIRIGVCKVPSKPPPLEYS
jgi:hypothetical protein